jgi:ABC-type dipeptide/oligopeptide/nickel transport system permease component
VLSYIVRRLALSIPTLFGVLVVVFLLLRVAPGDVVQEMVGERADPETIARLRKELHLDEPLMAAIAALYAVIRASSAAGSKAALGQRRAYASRRAPTTVLRARRGSGRAPTG